MGVLTRGIGQRFVEGMDVPTGVKQLCNTESLCLHACTCQLAQKDEQGIPERDNLPRCRSWMDPNPGIYNIQESQACYCLKELLSATHIQTMLAIAMHAACDAETGGRVGGGHTMPRVTGSMCMACCAAGTGAQYAGGCIGQLPAAASPNPSGS